MRLMQNNLQADFEQFSLDNSFIESEAIDMHSKLLKKLKKGSWLELGSDILKVNIIVDKYLSKATLYSNDNYIFIKLDSKKKKYKKIETKDFYFKMNLNIRVLLNNMLLNKNPISATLMNKSKDFAKVKLYFQDKIYVEIEGIL